MHFSNIIFHLIKALIFNSITTPSVPWKYYKFVFINFINFLSILILFIILIHIPHVGISRRLCHTGDLALTLIHTIMIKPSFKKIEVICYRQIIESFQLCFNLVSILFLTWFKHTFSLKKSFKLFKVSLVLKNSLMIIIKQTVFIFSNILAIIRERLIVDLRILQHAFATGSQVPT